MTHLTQRGEFDLTVWEIEKQITVLWDITLISKQNDSSWSWFSIALIWYIRTERRKNDSFGWLSSASATFPNWHFVSMICDIPRLATVCGSLSWCRFLTTLDHWKSNTEWRFFRFRLWKPVWLKAPECPILLNRSNNFRSLWFPEFPTCASVLEVYRLLREQLSD